MARQKMLTAEILKKVPTLYSQDGLGGEAMVYAKFFQPWGSFTWYMTEYDPSDRIAFGKVFSSMCPDGEYGNFSLEELEGIRGPGGLYIERDIHFKPCKLKECNRYG